MRSAAFPCELGRSPRPRLVASKDEVTTVTALELACACGVDRDVEKKTGRANFHPDKGSTP
eukprot:1180176-Prorocentrum_minimum.AAC.1